jgi:hypothetical protein
MSAHAVPETFVPSLTQEEQVDVAKPAHYVVSLRKAAAGIRAQSGRWDCS